MSENGSHRLRNSEDGVDLVGKVKAIRRCCFVVGVRESANHLSGNKSYSPQREEGELVLTSHDGSSLIADRLCDKARGKNSAISCFYFDFAARKEQSAISVLGSLVKQLVNAMERIPEEISRAFQEQKTTIGGLKPQLADIVKMLRVITTSQPTFMCIDAIDECAGVERLRLLDSLKEILRQPTRTRIYVTGRPHIRTEVESRLAGYVATVSVASNIGDMTRYLRVRLSHDETPDAMDECLKAEILKTIPANMSEMCVWVVVLWIPFHIIR